MLFLLSYSPMSSSQDGILIQGNWSIINTHRRLPLKLVKDALRLASSKISKHALFWACPSPAQLSRLFYLIKSKSSAQDAHCSIYDKFLHFISYNVDFFIQGQISYLMNARPRASTVLKMSSAFSLSLISGGSSKTTVLKRWFLCS